MRRREEGLGFWLSTAPQAHDRRAKIGAVLGSWLKLPLLAPAAIDLSTDVQIDANPRTESFLQAAAVVNGLGFPGQNGCTSEAPMVESGNSDRSRKQQAKVQRQDNNGSNNEGSSDSNDKATIPEQHAAASSDGNNRQAAVATAPESKTGLETPGQDVASDHLPGVGTVDFSWMTHTVVKSRDLIPVALVKFRALWKAGSETRARSATLLDNLPAPTDALVSFLPLSLPVRVGTPRFTRFPHSRKSVDLGSLGVQESERLVHEGETVRGIERGQGELLAVFLNVPVEIVSRVRFVEETKQLLYTLTPRPDLMRTRVHDMLAVRDRKTGETHLVPHRTRYRMAFLA